jgi:sugar lactone lactonase YvrE
VDKAGNLYVSDFWTNTVRKVKASSGIISNYAGNSTAGYSGDGGPATQATLNAPGACALDTAGNLYIADSGNNVIRKVAASTGIISTVAGNGYGAGLPAIHGFSGDGGLATKAELAAPGGLAVDAAGNLFISDLINQRVREVKASTGIISTIAGNGTFGLTGTTGPATSSMIGTPEGLVLDGSGNLYIAEEGVDAIAKINLASGSLSIVAGGGASSDQVNNGDGGPATQARLSAPTTVALDSAGDLYISDSGYARIRKITASTGVITTVAGTSAGYAGDGGSASKAKLNLPIGLSVDSSGNLYIVDSQNSVIRKVTY